MSDREGFSVAIVGATGAVGLELIKCLEGRQFPVKQLRLFASSKSAGKTIPTFLGDILIEEFSVIETRRCDFVFLAVSGEFSLQYSPLIIKDGGPFVIDNSSAFRYHDEIPLVVSSRDWSFFILCINLFAVQVPEINAKVLSRASKLISNPNCTTAIAAVVLWPLHCEFGIRKLIVSTYQAASGAGAEGMEELLSGTRSYLTGEKVTSSVFAHPLPFNLIPHIDKFQDNGYTKEEMKVVWETRKIFGVSEADTLISCTAVRIPTLRAHSESITIETVKPVDPNSAR